MLRPILFAACLLFATLSHAQQSAFELCKRTCHDEERACRKKCPFLGGGQCKDKCNDAVPQCKVACRSAPGECSVYSMTDPYTPLSLTYLLALSTPKITEETARTHLANMGWTNVDEFKAERQIQQRLPDALRYLEELRDCIGRNSRVRLFQFRELPRYTFNGGYFDFTPLRDKTTRVYNSCARKETIAVRFKGSDDALRFVMPEREASYLVHVTRGEEMSGGSQIGISINGGGSSLQTFTDHIVRDPDPRPQPERGQANIGFYGHVAKQVETKQVEKGDPLAPICRQEMVGGMAEAMLPQISGTVAGKTTILTLTVDEIRIEDRRHSVMYDEGGKR